MCASSAIRDSKLSHCGFDKGNNNTDTCIFLYARMLNSSHAHAYII